MLASYHNHTTWSDGKGSMAQLVESAQGLGLGEVGISDHLTLHPTDPSVSWAMPPDQVGAYVQDLLATAERSRAGGGPVVRLGLEADWFAATEPALRETLAALPLDYVIGSVHYNGDFAIDGFASTWEHPRFDVGPLIGEALDAIAEARMVVEINTNGWHCPCREAYPSAAILEQCRRRDIAVTLSADAHDPTHLLRDFPAAARMLRDAGYDQVARFADRQVRFEPLASAVPA
jgi:histidinol-phosphatase (PHP family)